MIKFFLLFISITFLFSSKVFAIDITYPIPELGNCNNAQTCKVYCDQPENKDSCIAFAKSKNLYKETVRKEKVNTLSFAKDELGCNSIKSCKNYCEQKINQSKCQSFAQKHGLFTSQEVSPKDEELLSKAKQNLNCDSFDSCKALCDQKANYTKCAGLYQDQVTSDDRAMFEKYKPLIQEFLGCDSIVTCMAFCMNPLNMPKCQELGNKIGGSEQIQNQEPPEVWCPKYSSECRWDGTTCVCQGPQTCAQSNDIPGCTWDGTQCNCPGLAEEPPEVWCPKAGSGCAWDGKHCICPGTSETPIQTEEQGPGEVWCPKLGPYCVWDGSSCTCWDDCMKAGGTWTGQRCELPPQSGTTTSIESGLSQPTPEPGEVWCPRNPGCNWTGETCLCTPIQAPQTGEQAPIPQVQGVTTNQGLLQKLLNFLLSL